MIQVTLDAIIRHSNKPPLELKMRVTSDQTVAEVLPIFHIVNIEIPYIGVMICELQSFIIVYSILFNLSICSRHVLTRARVPRFFFFTLSV